MAKLTKKQKKINELMEGFVQPTSALEAIKKLQEIAGATSKFDETLECHMRLGIDVKHADQQIRSTTVLPAGLGKEVRVCVIAKADLVAAAKAAGAEEAGSEEIIDKIGLMPLPPYITEKLEEKDRYQTVYAKDLGSAAAPTAGLHFTNDLLKQIEKIFAEIPVFYLFNKMDLIEDREYLNEYIDNEENSIFISAIEGEGIDLINKKIDTIKKIDRTPQEEDEYY